MSESPRDGVSDFVKILVGLVLLLGVVYGVLVIGNVLASLLPILLAGLLWLLYRLVVALERIAAAQERRARAVERRADVGDGGGGADAGTAAETSRSGANASDTDDPTA